MNNSFEQMAKLLEHGQDSERYQKTVDFIMEHDLTKEFLEKYEAVVTDDMIKRGLSNLLHYIYRMEKPPRANSERFYRPKLYIYDGEITLSEELRPEVMPLVTKAPGKRGLDLSRMSLDNQAADWASLGNEMGFMSAIGEAQRVINEYQDGKKVKGFWLVGTYGIGKSHLVCAMAKELNKKLAGVTVMPINRLLDELKAEMKSHSSSGMLEKKLEALETVDVLILDDIGAESLSDWYLNSVLFRLVDERYKSKRLTCFTSNITRKGYNDILERFKAKDGESFGKARAHRIMDRIIGLTVEVQANGQNRRHSA